MTLLKRYWFLIIVILSLGYCVTGIEIIKPTPENIKKWERRKFELVQINTCWAMQMEIDEYLKSQKLCTDDLSKLIQVGKLLSMAEDDIASLPMEHKSLDGISFTIDTIECRNNIVNNWKTCPTGYEFKNK